VLAYNAAEDALAAQDDGARAALIVELAGWARQQLGLPPETQLFLAGHSKGAKLAALAAALAAAGPAGQRVAGLVLIDPVDASYERLPGWAAHLPLPWRRRTRRAAPPCPRLAAAAAAAAMQQAAAHACHVCPALPPPTRRSVSALELYSSDGGGAAAATPALIIGASRNRDCVPPASNYARFFSALPGPACLVELPQAGHLQFLDRLTTLQQAVCSLGPILGRPGQGEVPAATAELVAAWLGALQAAEGPGATSAAGAGLDAAAWLGQRMSGAVADVHARHPELELHLQWK
jgi:pimeloyl-ACP methyl ester carboxylesterase